MSESDRDKSCLFYLDTRLSNFPAPCQPVSTCSNPGDIGGHVQAGFDAGDELELLPVLPSSLVHGDLAVLLPDGGEVFAVLGNLHASDEVELGRDDLDVGEFVPVFVQSDDGDGVTLDVLAGLGVEVDLTTVGDVEDSLGGGVEDDLSRGHLRVQLGRHVLGCGQSALGVNGSGRDLAEGNGVDEGLVGELGDQVEVFACVTRC